ncbi:MAG: hypothetical protein QOK08_2544 [Actinomycetota bacterium]|jgi:DNA-binding IclR family transcriptional regulator|nr:hypothetical protein [Actinomycetota bacterium]
MMTIKTPQADSGPAISVLNRAFQVLNVVGESGRPLSLAEISRDTGLPKTTVHRVLQQMLELGAVERDGDMYRIGIHMFVLSSVVPEMVLRGVALQRLIELQRHTGHTLHLATMRNDRVVYLEKIANIHGADIPTTVGGSFSAHATGVGKAMLAYLPIPDLQRVLDGPLDPITSRTITSPSELVRCLEQVRKVGLAFDDCEAATAVRCIAHPILLMGEAIAAVSISFPRSAVLEKRAIAALRETCTSISGDMNRRIRSGAQPQLRKAV